MRKDALKFANEKYFNGHSNSRSVQENFDLITSFIQEAADKHIPSKISRSACSVPWITPGIRRMIRKRNKTHAKAKKTGNSRLKTRFQELRKEIKMRLKSNMICMSITWLVTSGQTLETSTGMQIVRGKITKESHPWKREMAVVWRNLNPIRQRNLMDSLPMYSLEVGLTRLLCLIGQPREWMTFLFLLTGLLNFWKAWIHQKQWAQMNYILESWRNLLQNSVQFLHICFQQSLDTGEIPEEWSLANICPLFKKGDRALASNYRPVSLTCILCKLLEHIVYSNIMDHLEKHSLLSDRQHAFRKKHSCETQLVTVINDWAKILDKGGQVDTFILDFEKAFDTPPHELLKCKLFGYGIRGKTLLWIDSFLCSRQQRVVINGAKSKWAPVLSGVPQGTVLGPLLFSLYNNDIMVDIDSEIRLFADDCVFYRQIHSIEDTVKLQRDINRLGRYGAWDSSPRNAIWCS